VYVTHLDTVGAGIFAKCADDFPFDAYFTLPFNVSFEMTDILGGGFYQLMDTGVQAAARGKKLMNESEYKEFAGNFTEFCLNKIVTRKFPSLAQSESEAYELLVKADKKLAEFGKKTRACTKFVEDHGCPVLGVGGLFHPLDFIMDYFRDFTGIVRDMRRHPEELLEALEVLNDFLLKQACPGSVTGDDGKMLFWPCHIPSFIKKTDFDKFYFPFFKKQLDYAMNVCNNKVGVWLEGDWSQHYDTLQDLPDNDGKLLLMQEYADFPELKRKLGHKACISGGLNLSTIAYGTVEKNVNMTKKVIDECAPGGGFILATDQAIMAEADAKPENLEAVINTVINYGKY
jgi:hypothetical protein